MTHHVSNEQHDNYFSIMDAAGIETMAELSQDAHAVVLTIASKDDKFLDAVRELVAAARSAGYREALTDVLVVRDLFDPDRKVGTLGVISVGELAKRGMTDTTVIGVCWAPGEEMCLEHALAYARRRASSDPNERGGLIYAGDKLHCLACRAEQR